MNPSRSGGRGTLSCCGLPEISVDWFGQDLSVQHFFLSHFHSDHYAGLNKDLFHPQRLLYCTEETKHFVKLRFSVPDKFFRVLYCDETIIIDVPKAPGYPVSVTAIDANHCPGAVMFLFEWENRRVLHTGDFRASSSMYENPVLMRGPIDHCYLDTSFVNYVCESLPSKELSIGKIINLISTHGKGDVYIVGDMLGNEDYLHAIAEHFNTQLDVEESLCAPRRACNGNHCRFEELKVTLGADVVVKAGPESKTRFHIISGERVKSYKEKLKAWDGTNRKPLLISTVILGATRAGENMLSKVAMNPQVPMRDCNFGYFVFWSQHSSAREARDFLHAIQARAVSPIVPTAKGGVDSMRRAQIQEVATVKPNAILSTDGCPTLFDRNRLLKDYTPGRGIATSPLCANKTASEAKKRREPVASLDKEGEKRSSGGQVMHSRSWVDADVLDVDYVNSSDEEDGHEEWVKNATKRIRIWR